MALTDDTWSRLDPEAGALPLRQRRLAVRGAAAVVGLAVVVAATAWSGVVRPHLTEGSGSGWTSGPGSVGITVSVRNAGLLPVRVVDVGAAPPGLRLVDAPDVPFTLGRGQERQLDLTYDVTDCSAIPPEVAVPVRSDTWWGTSTTRIGLPDGAGDALPDGEGGTDAAVLPSLVRAACEGRR